MSDPILEEIWRVRKALIKQHGGLDGYLDYVRSLDQVRRKEARRAKGRKGKRSLVKAPK
jgi:hypothetical protein